MIDGHPARARRVANRNGNGIITSETVDVGTHNCLGSDLRLPTHTHRLALLIPTSRNVQVVENVYAHGLGTVAADPSMSAHLPCDGVEELRGSHAG